MAALTQGQAIPSQVRAAATALIDDPAFKQARERLVLTYFRKWQLAKTTDERERLHVAASQVEDVFRELVYLRDHDKIDEQRIDAMAKRGAR